MVYDSDSAKFPFREETFVVPKTAPSQSTGEPSTPPSTVVTPSIDVPPPSFVIGGAKGKTAVRITSSQAFNGSVTVRLFASLDQSLDDSDLAVTTVAKTMKLKAGAGKVLKVNFTYPNADGSYRLLAEVDAGGAGKALASTATAFQLAKAYVDLSVEKVLVTPSGGAFLKNLGNIASTGTVMFEVFASNDQTLSDDDVLLSTLSKSMKLKPVTAKAIKLKFPADTHPFVLVRISLASDVNEMNNVLSANR